LANFDYPNDAACRAPIEADWQAAKFGHLASMRAQAIFNGQPDAILVLEPVDAPAYCI